MAHDWHAALLELPTPATADYFLTYDRRIRQPVVRLYIPKNVRGYKIKTPTLFIVKTISTLDTKNLSCDNLPVPSVNQNLTSPISAPVLHRTGGTALMAGVRF